MRASSSGITLTAKDAAIVKGMIQRGDRQHDIAAWFGVNGGRIGEINTGAKFSEVAVATKNLPPPGPYTSHQKIDSAKKSVLELVKSIESAALKVPESQNEEIVSSCKGIRQSLSKM